MPFTKNKKNKLRIIIFEVETSSMFSQVISCIVVYHTSYNG
jgi:hypothetical protein